MTSFSAIQTWQRCPRKYKYAYIDKIQPVQLQPKMSAGSWMHKLLEAHYKNENVRDLHEQLELQFVDKYASEEAQEIADLTWKVYKRYVEKYWEDENLWEIASVERGYEIEGISFTPDLVVKYKDGKGVWLVDHKTVDTIPQEQDKMLDFQRLAYIGGMIEAGYDVKGFIFNYIKRKLPGKPRMKKSGTPGIAYLKTIDTDYETLKAFVSGADPFVAKLPEVERRLEELVLYNNFFHRAYFPTHKEFALEIFNDMKISGMELAVSSLFPRNINTAPGAGSCHYCPYMTLCLGRALGINEEDALLDYEEKTKKGELV